MRPLALAAVLALAGCAPPPAPPPTARSEADADEPGHSHDRDKMKVEHLGKYHVGLTAHLSRKTGHELDLFVETAAGEPAALPLPEVRGTAVTAGDPAEREVVFIPAPADERPASEPAGVCSHYVAQVPWLKPDAGVTLTIRAEVAGRPRTATWTAFVPRAYAHVDE